MRAETLISGDGLADRLSQQVDVSGTMSGLPGVTSSAARRAHVARSALGAEGGERSGARGEGSSGMTKPSPRTAKAPDSPVHCEPGSRNTSRLLPPSGRGRRRSRRLQVQTAEYEAPSVTSCPSYVDPLD